jgi:DNA-binding beta-propeller fold protein YncE
VAVGAKGTISTANIGPERFGITLIDQVRNSWSVRHLWARTPNSTFAEVADPDWKGVSSGIVFNTDRTVWVSEGHSGRVRLLDIRTGNHEKIVNLNQDEWKNTFTGDLAFDSDHHILYVTDRSNSRVAVVDARRGQPVASVSTGRPLHSIALSPDRNTAYVTSTGGALGIIDVRTPAQPAFQTWIGEEGSPAADSAILALGDRVYVSNARDDSIAVISAAERRILSEIPLRIHALETLRGIRPGGIAYDSLTKWLLVTEAGINAVGVIDTTDPPNATLIGHIPVGWEPQRIAIAADRAYITNFLGRGTGPNLRRPLLEMGEAPTLHRGSLSTFVIPSPGELAKLTQIVYSANGFIAQQTEAHLPPPPEAIRHVVLIVKGNASFDEILGDIREATNPQNRRVQAVPQLARFGMRGLADGHRIQLSVKDVAVTPNQHAIAHRWAFSDNFYAMPEETGPGDLWAHLKTNGVDYRQFEEPDENLTDQARADRFIADLEKAKPLPQFVFMRLPNALPHTGPQPRGFPYPASFMADNDLAVGRILENLSQTPEWRNTVVFITENTSEAGLDHVDSHRTALLAAGPWVRRNYVTHTNSDSAGLMKTILSLLHVPPTNLSIATARPLNDIFTQEPDDQPFQAIPAESRIFDH